MRLKLSGFLGITLMLAMAFGATAFAPTGVAAAEGSIVCSYSLGADGSVNFDGSGATRAECKELLKEHGLAEPTGPGSNCLFVIHDGKVIEKGGCELAPTEVPATEVPATDADATDADATDADATDADATDADATDVDATDADATDADATDADATDADATDADATDADATDADATDADATDADATDADATDADATDADATDADTGGGKAMPGEEEAGATSLPSTGSGEQTGSSMMTLTVGFVAAAAVLGTTGLLISRDRRTN